VSEQPVGGNPCNQCPWRLANQGKPHPFGFYRKDNLTRLWNQIRKAKGAQAQGCHPTDPSHPDHVASGTPPTAKPQECLGSVILIARELRALEAAIEKAGDDKQGVEIYLKSRKYVLSRRGLLHWLVGRYQMGGTPFGTGPKLPIVNEDNADVGLPEYLRG
jgi:hypothetical protein